MKLLPVVVIALAAPLAYSQSATSTQITDTIRYQNNALASGRAMISGPRMVTSAGVTVAPSIIRYNIVSGVFSVRLERNSDAQPNGTFYTVEFILNNGQQYTEYWVIPASATPITLASVRILNPLNSVFFSQFREAGSAKGDLICFNGSIWTRLAVGSNGTVLIVDSAAACGVNWGSGSGFTLNTLTGAVQTLATGTSGTDFAISSVGSTHTFNIPSSSASARGLLTSADWSTFNSKGDASTNTASSTDGRVALFNGVGGKTLRQDTQTGVARLTSGVLGVVSGVASDCVKVDGSSGACGAGGGITSLNGQTGSSQTFTNDTNVTIVSATNAHAITWSGTLAKTRQNAATVYNDAANTYSTGLQDFLSASLRVPSGAGLGESASGRIGYDTTANAYKFGVNGVSKTVVFTDSLSSYLPLTGGVLTGQLGVDNLGLDFEASDTNPGCVAGNFRLYADLSENKLKKCQNGTLEDLDTTAGTPSFSTLTGGTNTGAAMVVGTGASLSVSGSGTIAATTAAALAVNPTPCGANQWVTDIAADGTLICAQPAFSNVSGSVTDAQVPDTITVSNYLLLTGGTLTGQLGVDNLGLDFDPSDTNPSCAAGNFRLYADLSENKLKKCQNGTLEDLDTTAGTPSFSTITGGTNSAAAMIIGTGASLGVSGSGTNLGTFKANAQTGTTYTVLSSDRDKVITFSNAGAVAVTLPQAGTTGFEDGFLFVVKSIGAGVVTITPTTSTISGAASIALNNGQTCWIASDGTNYEAECGERILPGTGLQFSYSRIGTTVSISSVVQTKAEDQTGGHLYAADAQASDAYQFCPSPAVSGGYVNGMVFYFKAQTVNTGAFSVDVCTMGVKQVYVRKDQTPSDGDVKAGQDVGIIYDSTLNSGVGGFQMFTVSGNAVAGITSLNGLSTSSQTFVNDTNVTIVSAGSTHTVTWAGTLAKARQNAATVYNDAANTYSAGLQDFASVSLRIPTAAGLAETISGRVGYDSTANAYKFGVNGVSKTLAFTDSSITGTSSGFTTNPGNCAAGQLPRGVDGSGVAEGCAPVDLAAEVTGILPGANGGTGNGFFAISGPTTSLKTFSLPNANAAILTDNALVTVAQGGSGANSLTGIIQGNGTSAFTTIINSVTVGQVLRVTGSNAYGFGAVDLADSDAVTGILPTGNLPNPTVSAKGAVQAKVCPGGDFVSALNTDSTVTCGTPSGGAGTGVGRTSSAVNFSTAIPDGTCAANTFTWTGITTSDTITPGWPSGLPAGVIGNMFASAADTVTIRLCNVSGASVTPGNLTYKATLAVYNLSGSSAINFGAIPDGTCAVNTFTLTGAAVGDPVSAGWPSTLEASLLGAMRVSATDTVEIRLCSFNGTIDPANQTFAAAIAK